MRRFVISGMLAMSAAARADVDAKKIDGVFTAWAKKDGPGCAVGVVQDGKVVHAKGYGMADLERHVPIGAETVFDIGSVSKQFTAASIRLLAADGKLGLDDDIRKWVPELPQIGKKPITIRNLLHHTGGLRDYTALLVLGGARIADVTTSKEALAALARQKGVEFEPGAKYAYSNSGYFVLAQIVERASKQSMARFVDERIFKPLGMTKTMILDDHARIVPDRALAYAPRDPGWKIEMSGWEQTGDGQVQTTVVDLAKWDANFYAPKVGGKALVDGMLERGKTADGKELDYASGLVHTTYRGQATVQHGGAWAGYRAELMRFPAYKTTIAVLCNAASANPTRLANGVADVVLGDKLAPAPKAPEAPAAPAVKLSAAQLDAWAGTYRETAAGEIVTIKRTGDGLVVEGNGESFALVPTSASMAALAAMPGITVELAGATGKRTLVLRGLPKEEHYAELAPYKPAATELAALAGRYASSELATQWTLAVVNGALVVSGRGIDDGTVLQPSRDELAFPGAGVHASVVRGPKGVAGFDVALGDGKLRFDRVP